jgi:hypothetical protein
MKQSQTQVPNYINTDWLVFCSDFTFTFENENNKGKKLKLMVHSSYSIEQNKHTSSSSWNLLISEGGGGGGGAACVEVSRPCRLCDRVPSFSLKTFHKRTPNLALNPFIFIYGVSCVNYYNIILKLQICPFLEIGFFI